MESSKRNSLIELFRFVFALFIVFYHNLFVVEINYFSNANYFVDFFFLVTGMYLLKSFEKYKDQNFIKGSYRFFLDKIIKFGIPLLISYLALVVSNWLSTPNELKSRYLWFIHIMLIMFIVFFLLFKIFKKNKSGFYLTVTFMFLIAAFFRYAVLINFPGSSFNELFSTTYYFDELRGVECMSLGILLSALPDLVFKNEKTKKIIPAVVLVFATIVVAALVSVSSFNFTSKVIVEIISDLLLFPAIIYFSRYVVLDNRIMNILGESSLYIYIYQTACLLERSLNVTNQVVLFATLAFMVVITMVWKLELRRKKALKLKNAG